MFEWQMLCVVLISFLFSLMEWAVSCKHSHWLAHAFIVQKCTSDWCHGGVASTVGTRAEINASEEWLPVVWDPWEASRWISPASFSKRVLSCETEFLHTTHHWVAALSLLVLWTSLQESLTPLPGSSSRAAAEDAFSRYTLSEENLWFSFNNKPQHNTLGFENVSLPLITEQTGQIWVSHGNVALPPLSDVQAPVWAHSQSTGSALCIDLSGKCWSRCDREAFSVPFNSGDDAVGGWTPHMYAENKDRLHSCSRDHKYSIWMTRRGEGVKTHAISEWENGGFDINGSCSFHRIGLHQSINTYS